MEQWHVLRMRGASHAFLTASDACVKLIAMSKRIILLALFGLAVFGLEFAIISGLDPGLSLKIAAGFLSLFFLPGFCLSEIFLKNEDADFWDRLAFGFLLSLALFSLPGLFSFHFALKLETVFRIFIGLSIICWVAALAKIFLQSSSPVNIPGEEINWGKWIALLLIFGAGVLAWFVGASRGPETDWDLYNYISMVRKFLVWGQAGIHHYFYADAPPDPIHSYNLHALIWALIAYKNKIEPIPLYIHSAFLTVPLCFFSFLSLARRTLGERGGFLAFSFYFFFQLIYGGLYFVGNSTFYPDDAIWLMCFPSLLSLAFIYLEKGSGRLLLLGAFSGLGVSIVHPLWGLAFYIVLAFFLAAETFRQSGAINSLHQSLKENFIKKLPLLLIIVLVFSPYLFSLIYFFAKITEQPKQWFEPLFLDFFLDRLWFYGLVFILLPIVIFIATAPMKSIIAQFKASEFFQKGYFKQALILILVSLAVSLPYIFLRQKVVESTNWSSFGRNPYRGMITPALFLLNPFKRSFTDPNMTFHPIFWLGFLLCPWLFSFGKSKSRPLALAAFCSLAGIVLWVLHPVLATLFAKFFSLGYLRRILRLAGLLSFLPIGAFLEDVFSRFKLKTAYAYGLGLIIAAAISWALVPVPAEPLYSGLFKRMTILAKPENRDTLMTDDAPFKFLAAEKSFQPGDVIFSDLYTSFRATAYLGCYVAVQAKPGVGVADQDERRFEELEFFDPLTGAERMLSILKKRNVTWVIINRNPQYQFYNLALGHPETIAKLEAMPQNFQKVFDKGDWVIFRVN